MLRRKFTRVMRRSVTRRRPLVLAAGLLAAAGLVGGALLGAGIGVAQPFDDDDRSGDPQLQAALSLEDAQRIALEGRGTAVVTQVGLEYDDGRLVYSVDLSDGTEVEIDAANGSVIATEQDDAQPVIAGDQVLRPQISLAAAQQTALDANLGASVDEIELERGANGLVYQVELTNDMELVIDATTGAILQSARDD